MKSLKEISLPITEAEYRADGAMHYSTLASFKNYITSGNIIEEYHPAYYARNNSKISRTFFKKLKKAIKYQFDVDIEWFHEYKQDKP